VAISVFPASRVARRSRRISTDKTRSGLTVATIDPSLLCSDACNYAVFPFAFTLIRPFRQLFSFSASTLEQAQQLVSTGTKLRHEIMRGGGMEWDGVGDSGGRSEGVSWSFSVARMYYIFRRQTCTSA
jgi:hypothetical protein